jgi:hypothetical protein
VSLLDTQVPRRIFEIAGGAGGQAALVYGAGTAFYAGAGRAPAATLLEALLTFAARPAYQEILVFTGSGDHLPELDAGRVRVGLVPGGWTFRGLPSREPAAPPSRDADDDLGLDLDTLLREDRPPGALGELFPAQAMASTERVERLLQEVEQRCGWKWQGVRFEPEPERVEAARTSRRLVLIDSAYLLAGARDFEGQPEHRLLSLERRFQALVSNVRGTGIDLLLFCPDQETAAALTGKPAQAGGPANPLRWREGAEIWRWPTMGDRPFGDLLRSASPRLSLYETLRTVPPTPPPDPLRELDRVIGLEQVKTHVRRLFYLASDYVQRRSAGQKAQDFLLHAAFLGNPGTGKTTVARLLGNIYGQLGLLSGNKLTEVRPRDLIGQYVRHTAERTAQVCERALGGVLFIDEAYGLLSAEGQNDFGPEAIDELLKWMTERKGELAIFFAGYPDQMNDFFRRANPGFSGRIKHFLRFEDYSDEELVRIAHIKADTDTIEAGADPAIREELARHRRECRRAGLFFRNAGEVEKLVEEARVQRAQRLQLDPGDLARDVLTIDDFRNVRLDLPMAGAAS